MLPNVSYFFKLISFTVRLNSIIWCFLKSYLSVLSLMSLII